MHATPPKNIEEYFTEKEKIPNTRSERHLAGYKKVLQALLFATGGVFSDYVGWPTATVMFLYYYCYCSSIYDIKMSIH